MNKTTFEDLLIGYVNNTLSKADLKLFLDEIQKEDHAENLKEAIENFLADEAFPGKTDPQLGGKLFANIMSDVGKVEPEGGKIIPLKQGPSILKWIGIAASVAGLIGLSIFFYTRLGSEKEAAKNEAHTKPVNDVTPGGNKAVLTLADGSTIVLDDAQNGKLAQQGNTKVIKLNGKLDYNASGSSAKEILYNTIATPRGGQYQIELPDGSQVWLNAASSLHFPTVFAGKERRVEITGEAYFEVAKDKSMPFIVKVNNAEVQVLGTHFNVMAYSDEAAVKTTLLEGSVKFVSQNNSTVLKPGQQSQLAKDGQVKVANEVDLDKVMAWKNGLFKFGGEDIETVCRQLARWYDVEVVYNQRPDDLFYADIPRNTSLADAFKALELTGKVHFKIEGRKVIVMP
jgi:ferric-dicitrate binding protein FerR (iron transport regulator)